MPTPGALAPSKLGISRSAHPRLQRPAAVLALTRSATAWLHLAQRVSGKGRKKKSRRAMARTKAIRRPPCPPGNGRPVRPWGEATNLARSLCKSQGERANRSRNGRGARQLVHPYNNENTQPPCPTPRATPKGNGRNRSHNGRGARQLVLTTIGEKEAAW